jgi:hypothetical protein
MRYLIGKRGVPSESPRSALPSRTSTLLFRRHTMDTKIESDTHIHRDPYRWAESGKNAASITPCTGPMDLKLQVLAGLETFIIGLGDV